MPRKNYDEHKRKMRERYQEKKEELRLKSREYYQKNREKCIEKAKQYVVTHGRKVNPEAVRKASEKYRKNNPEVGYERNAIYRANIKNACPKWIDADDRFLIKEMYFAAKEKKKVTGLQFHVDHIVPLQNKRVCGLHVPWNLQLLTASENQSKYNKFGEYA